jgi:hypothetical protein
MQLINSSAVNRKHADFRHEIDIHYKYLSLLLALQLFLN